MGAGSSRKVQNYEADKVYFFTFPSIRSCPTFSPYALRVETWLRLRGVDYEAIRGFNNWSQKGLIPFIELNGEEINESSRIIRELAERLDKPDMPLDKEQLALCRMIETMLDNHTVWSYASHRMLSDESKQFFEMWEGFTAVQRFVAPTFLRRKFRNNFVGHGIGRNTLPEVHSMGCDDIRALSGILGQKQFMMGSEMTIIDCIVFGHLAQIYYLPLNPPHKTVLIEETPNLVEYLDRIRELCWPDWEEFCLANLQPTTR